MLFPQPFHFVALLLVAQTRAVKRPRLVWTPELHKVFEEAVQKLGVDKAVPKTIMQMMKVEGLTRENVASHLQKYRLSIKRAPADNTDGKTNSPADTSAEGNNMSAEGNNTSAEGNNTSADNAAAEGNSGSDPPMQDAVLPNGTSSAAVAAAGGNGGAGAAAAAADGGISSGGDDDGGVSSRRGVAVSASPPVGEVNDAEAVPPAAAAADAGDQLQS
eukprot:GHUV01039804.1.p1 GENE.GHUV01039804.1~~GHUV01039804.1.p1  ORF type:complete len:217 (+),score=96.17 GHUV01039804.1:1-651(+)